MSFPDPVLRALVRADLLAATGTEPGEPIDSSELEVLTTFNHNNAGITNLEGMQALINLTTVSLNMNQITDLQPLVDNPGIGGDDTISLLGNTLSTTAVCTQAAAIRARLSNPDNLIIDDSGAICVPGCETGPVITCPGDRRVRLTGCQAVVPDLTPELVYATSCPGDVTVTQTPAPGTTVTNDTVITFTVTDAQGTATECDSLLSVPTCNRATTDVSGRITQGGTGVSCATVVLEGDGEYLGTTNEEGNYTIFNVPTGILYSLHVFAANATHTPQDVTIDANEPALDLSLTTLNNTRVVFGKVRDEAGNPIYGAKVEGLVGGIVVASTFTCRSGDYQLALPAPTTGNDVLVAASVPGFKSSSAAVTVANPGSINRDFTTERATTASIITGTARTTHDNTSLDGTSIFAAANFPLQSTETNDEGVYSIAFWDASSGQVELEVTADCHEPLVTSAGIAGQTTSFDVTLTAVDNELCFPDVPVPPGCNGEDDMEEPAPAPIQCNDNDVDLTPPPAPDPTPIIETFFAGIWGTMILFFIVIGIFLLAAAGG